MRSYAEHEGYLLNSRVTWLLVSNAFLFAGAGLALRELATSKNGILALFVLFAAVAGFLISALAMPSIWASMKASETLDNAWQRYSRKLKTLRAETDAYFVVPLAGAGHHWASKAGSIAALCLPIVLGAGWLVVMISTIRFYVTVIKPCGSYI